MTRQEFIEKMRELVPDVDRVSDQWCQWLEQHDMSYQGMHAVFYGVHQQYGGELAGLMYLKGPRHYCLHPNEFMLAAEYLYDGGATEQIDERPSHTEKQDCPMCQPMQMRQGGQ